MTISALNADQTDALQEVVNIAMGQAGDRLAQTLNVFVELSVPRIRLVCVSEVVRTVREMISNTSLVSAVRQAFFDELRGEAVVIYDNAGCKDLANLMGYDDELSTLEEQELLLDVSNVLVGACVNGVAQQFGADLSFSPPSIMAEKIPLDLVLSPENLSWQYALLVEVNFGLENSDFKSHLLILMAEEGIDALRGSLDRLMEAI